MRGEPGCGKTFLALDVGLCVAEGREWFGHKTKPGRVVYVAAEAGRSIRNRVAAWAQERWSDGEIDFQAAVSPVNLCDLKMGDADRLAAAIGAADVVIVDTVSRALAGGDENAPADMGTFVNTLDRLRARLGCAIIAVHHVGKDASRGARGHSLLLCAVDTEIAVERRDGDICVATVTKQRDMPAGVEIAFRLRSVDLGQDQDGDPVTSCVVEAADYVPAAKAKGPTGQAKFGLDVLNQAIAEQGKYRPCGGDIEVRAVKVDVWREYMVKSGLFGDDAKFRNAWLRVQAKLNDGGHVGFQDGFVWPTRTVEDVPF